MKRVEAVSIPDDLKTLYYTSRDNFGIVETSTIRLMTLIERIGKAEAKLRELHTLRPASEWHEDYGTVLWHHLPIQEPPHVGTPLDSDWDYYDEGYYTHWSPIPMNPTVVGEPRDL